MREAGVHRVQFIDANLCRVNLQHTDLNATVFRNSDISGADFTGAQLRETTFLDVDLRNCVGLEQCKFFGHSTIDLRTICKSWPLPLAFLRGVGLPDEYIDYLPSLLQQAIQFYSCFISYATADTDFAERLHADLQNKGIRCWFAPEKMKGGEKLHTQLSEAIRLHDKLILILSEHSMRSDWVAYEIKQARRREKREGRQALFPVSVVPYDELEDWKLFDADTVMDLGAEVRSYYIPDFTRWKEHDAYQKALGELLKGLKAEG